MEKILTKLLLLSFATLSYSHPLSITSSRWIIDKPTGARVKLACANWVGHLEPMFPEGLNLRPVGETAAHLAQMGFNCVRLTWPIHMYTRFANLTVTESLSKLGLQDTIDGVTKNNPQLLNMTIVDAQKAVIEDLANQNVLVILDNHVSQPMWCCDDNDGNGFFGDKYFDPIEWLHAFHIVATRYRNTPSVVGMSMRNELRGPRQNETIWYRYMEKGAMTIHNANPNLLVIVSGLNYDLEFSQLKNRQLRLNFRDKIVFEAHRYAFTNGQSNQWLSQPFSQFCETIKQEIYNQSGFLSEGGSPLFISEFGVNQQVEDPADSLFLACYLTYLAENDLDWGIWTFEGSYYINKGVHVFEEQFGMLSTDWKSLRNPTFHKKLQIIQRQNIVPWSNEPTYYIMFHLWSGRCIHTNNSQVHAGECSSNFGKWNFTSDGNPIRLKGTELCLSAAGEGLPATLSSDCNGPHSKWELVEDKKFQLANRAENGTYLCLETDPNDPSGALLTKKCTCVGNNDNCGRENNQWFKFIPSNAQ